MKTTNTDKKQISLLLLCAIWLLNLSCSTKMDEKTVTEYFNSSPAVTLYAYCFFNEEQPDLKADFLGKDQGRYYYKAYNYKVDRIEDFQLTDKTAEGTLYLTPTNETEACKRYDEQNKHTPHKAQVENGTECTFQFINNDGKWELTVLRSERYIRTYWQPKQSCTGTKWHDLIDLDEFRHRENKNYEY